MGPTAREKALLVHDKQKMNLSGLRILTLSLALELGRVPGGGSVASIIYGSDPRLSDMAKSARKAGLSTMSKVLESGDLSKLGLFLTSIIRDYAERGLIVESQLNTAQCTAAAQKRYALSLQKQHIST